MAYDSSDVGAAGSGADYAATPGALQLWEDYVEDEDGQDNEAVIITDIADDVVFNGFRNYDTKLRIRGDLTGATKRRITAWDNVNPGTGNHCLLFSDSDLEGDLIIEDLIIDGSQQAAGKGGIYLSSAWFASVEISRVRVTEATGYGIIAGSTGRTPLATLENVIVDNGGAVGVYQQCFNAASTWTLKNCGFFKNGTNGIITANNANLTTHLYNCVSMYNSTKDFYTSAANASVNLYTCVSSDSSATSVDHDTADGCVDSETDYTDYFNGWADDDFTLAQDDNENWGINGQAAPTPAEDFASVTRTNDDIGPFEYVASFSPAIAQCGRTMRMGVGLGI